MADFLRDGGSGLFTFGAVVGSEALRRGVRFVRHGEGDVLGRGKSKSKSKSKREQEQEQEQAR